MSRVVQIRRVDRSGSRGLFSRVAEVHRKEIRDGFLVTLGQPFLAKLYRALARSPHAFLIVATEGGEVVGFVCGSVDTAKVYRRFMFAHAPFILPAVLPTLVSPTRFRRILETLLYPSNEKVVDLPKAEILNFCVASDHQRKGIGRLLFDALQTEFCARRIYKIRIVTGVNQMSAQRFYESIGAVKTTEIEVHSGTGSFVYTYECASDSVLPVES